MSPEITRLEFAFMIVALISVVVGYFAATQPARRKLWARVRAGLTYAMLVIRKVQSDRLERERRRRETSASSAPSAK